MNSDASIGVNAEWNDRFLIMVILDNDHSKSYTSADEILYLDQLDLLAQRETLHSVLAFPAGSLTGKKITSKGGDLLLLLGGNYTLGSEVSPAAGKADVMPMSLGMAGLGNSLDVSLYSRDDASKSGVAIEDPVITSSAAELIGIPEAGSKITSEYVRQHPMPNQQRYFAKWKLATGSQFADVVFYIVVPYN